MRIILGKTVLADGTPNGGMVAGYRETVTRQADSIYPARSSKGKVRDRGGELIRIAFTVEREFDTYFDAQRFIQTHRRDATREGVLTVVAVGDGTGKVSAQYAPNAVLDQIEGSFVGCSVTFSYSIISEPLTNSIP